MKTIKPDRSSPGLWDPDSPRIDLPHMRQLKGSLLPRMNSDEMWIVRAGLFDGPDPTGWLTKTASAEEMKSPYLQLIEFL